MTVKTLSIRALLIINCNSPQNRLRGAEGLTRAESIQRLDYLKQHLLDLERQYEKSKPLVNLVDNMVKLGSLYRNDANGRAQPATMDRLEFNQRMQERQMLQEEQKQWDRLSPNQTELQVMQKLNEPNIKNIYLCFVSSSGQGA